MRKSGRVRSESVKQAKQVVRLSRRLVLGLLASSAGAADAFAAANTAVNGGRDTIQGAANSLQTSVNTSQGQAPIGVVTEILIPIIRPDDLLVISIVLRNLQVSGGQITLINPAQQGILIACHQPQSILEQAWQQSANASDPYPPAPPGVASTRMSGWSYVAYSTPGGFTGIAFTLKAILDALQTWPIRLDGNAQPLPADPLGLNGALHSLDGVKAQLEGAAATLKAQLGATHGPALVNSLERAATRLVATMSDVARQGRLITSADYQRAVSTEVSASFGTTAANPSQRVLASSYVQAAAGAAVVGRPNPAVLHVAPTKPHLPGSDVTQLEIPYQLIETPLDTAGFIHADGVVTHGQQTELWHSRLGTDVGGVVVELGGEPLRAIWTTGYDTPNTSVEPPWPTVAMVQQDRHDIVDLTANWFLKQKTGQDYTPQPSLAKRLMLTAMGGTLELDGAWPLRPDGVDLEAWNHKAAIGRDYYVKLVYAGWLYPFGHAASYVQITERKFGTQADGKRVAVMLQRQFIIVRELSKTYPGPGQAYEGRDFPFQTIEIATRLTPDLVKPTGPASGIPDSLYQNPANPPPKPPPPPPPPRYFEAFWPVDLATGKDFPFHLVGTDGAGRRIPFEMPLFFLTDSWNDDAHLTKVEPAYNSAAAARTTPSMNGAKIQFAPQTLGTDSKGDTSFPCSNITFNGAAPSGSAPVTQPQFYPTAAKAQVSVPSVKAMLGADTTPTVSYSSIFKDNGFYGPNKGQVFLDIAAPTKLNGASDTPPTTFGGLITPSLLPSALSRSFGAVQGAAKNGVGAAAAFAQGTFNPTDFIPGDVKLLGAIPLSSVLNQVTNLATQSGAVPLLTNVELPDQIVATYSLTQSPLNAVDPLFVPDPSTSSLTINAQVIAKRDGSAPVSNVQATIANFKVNLFGCFILTFTSLELTAASGQKTDVSPNLDPTNGVLFGGPLEFVNGLRDIIPMSGFSDPPDLSVTPSGITASYSLSLPTIGLGVLSLSNVSLGAGFDLPFTGDAPSARFNFAERQSPFNLTISLFGGGGFFAIGVGADGVQEVEASLEFGAQISIDLGVASGGVYVKGGFYFHWVGATHEIDFEAYVEMGGHLSILDLISVSLVFHLALGYQKLPPISQLYGEASLTVEVTVLFFSFGVSVSVERTFAGSKSDPAFIDFAPNAMVWANYCEAFA